MLDLVARAAVFASEKHRGIVRPNRARAPYISHPAEVVRLVRRSGGTKEEIAAGWLHDVVEDTKTTIEEIRSEFGNEVACIVAGLTDPPEIGKMPTLDRKRFQADRVRDEDISIKRVKLCDQISNVRAILIDPPVHWSGRKIVDYVTGAVFIAHECRGISEYLDWEFLRMQNLASLII